MQRSSLSDWLKFLETLKPERICMGLDRIRPVAERLNLLPATVPMITVGGTNGKGTTVRALECFYRASGYRVGCYTSPHLRQYSERVRIEGQCVRESLWVEVFDQVQSAQKEELLTYFEYGTLAALLLLKQASLDVWILEVGMGGRLDAVNLWDADIAVLTSIDLDHQEWLGSTREAVAFEKMGIFREGGRAVVGDPCAPANVVPYALERQVDLWLRGRDFDVFLEDAQWSVSNLRDPQANFSAPYPHIPLDNAVTALMTAAHFSSVLPVNWECAIAQLTSLHLEGRLHALRTERGVFVFLDVAHNPHAGRYLCEYMEKHFSGHSWLAVIGMQKQKDIQGTLAPFLDRVEAFYWAPIDHPQSACFEDVSRCIPASKLHEHAHVLEAFEHAERTCLDSGRSLLVFGSFYTVGPVLEKLSPLGFAEGDP